MAARPAGEAAEGITAAGAGAGVQGMKTSDFQKGQRVKYVPAHANGDVGHKDCESGVVSSTNDKFVFVKYDNIDVVMVTGDEPYTAQATAPEDLVRLRLPR